MVMLAFAVRLNVVASLKVTPSVEFAEVCSTSLRKMSSCSLSGVATLLRVTVALPVRVATLPIGSSVAAAGCAGEGAVAGAGACAGWACADRVRPDIVSALTGQGPVSLGADIATALAAPESTRQPTSQTAKENRCRVTMEIRCRKPKGKMPAFQ